MTSLEALQESRIIRPTGQESAWRILKIALHSSAKYLHLLASGYIHLRRDPIGEAFRVEDGGTYQVFRDTESRDGTTAPTSVLVVGFRLRLIGSSPLLHWVFQRICILTTPIWSGFRGFRVKLWMVDQTTKNYLGIYEWAGEENAQAYVDWLAGLLLCLSTKGSVWYGLFPSKGLSEYLAARGRPGAS